ncbi:MAG TPA: hypothetical protein VM409_05040 [Chloroflexia bacterium]|nr:hypothetical protein [Chloroflexia bacterium]
MLNFLPGARAATPGLIVVDRDQNLWNLWWVRFALLHGHNPFVTDVIYYPTPVSLYFHTLNNFNGLLAVPLLSLFSLATTYNLIVLFSFVASGFGAYLLVNFICHDRWAAMVGSVVFAYSAYHLATMRGLLQLISVEWVPFFVLFLLRAAHDRPRSSRTGWARWLLVRALPAAVTLLLVALVDWYYTMYMLMLAGFLAIYLAAKELLGGKAPVHDRLARAGLALARIAIPILMFVMLISPILVPTLAELRSSTYMVPASDASTSFSADLLAFFQPPRNQQIWGGLFTNREAWPYARNLYEVYLTYTALFLAGAAFLLGPRGSAAPTTGPGRRFWAGCGFIFFLLALGPVLQINGEQVRSSVGSIGLPMPYTLIERLPVLNISRSPDRFDMPLTLCLAILAGWGTKKLTDRLSLRRSNLRPAVLSLGLIALLAVEVWPLPYPQRPAEVPGWYEQLGHESGDFSILELPPQDDFWHGAYRMRFQTEHQKRIFGGYISREYAHPFVQTTPAFMELADPIMGADQPADMLKSGREQWNSALALYKVRYIVLQKDRLPDRQDPPVDVSAYRAAIKQVLGPAGTNPHYSDAFLEVYAVPAVSFSSPFLRIGDGWGEREAGPNGAFRWMQSSATFLVEAPARIDASLTFRVAGLRDPRPLRIMYGGQVVYEGQVGALTELTVGPLVLPPGESTLTFVSPTGTTSPASEGLGDDPRQISFAVLDAELVPVP